ncbi:UDP-glucuronosyltransferase 1-1 [Homalodisca vitripennis]|nr:UDP-glucuronosyltransferase 1-1 [Homalodisca vitripennis]
MPARCAALRAACSFRKKINSSSSKFEAQITSVPLITNRVAELSISWPQPANRSSLITAIAPTVMPAVAPVNVHYTKCYRWQNMPRRILIREQPYQTWKFDDFFKICSKESFYGFGVDALWEVGLTVCEDVLKDSKISALLNSTEKFDLVFIEPLFAQESFIVFGHKFQAPVVNFQGFGTWSILNYMSGNSLSIPYIPDSRSFPFSNKMPFMERLQNTISTVITLTSYHMTHLPKHQKLIQQYYKNSTSPPILDMLRNISLTLANAHHTLEYTRPYTPNIVPIGGAHMSSHQDDLPQLTSEDDRPIYQALTELFGGKLKSRPLLRLELVIVPLGPATA